MNKDKVSIHKTKTKSLFTLKTVNHCKLFTLKQVSKKRHLNVQCKVKGIILQPVRYWRVGSIPGIFTPCPPSSDCTSWNPEGPCPPSSACTSWNPEGPCPPSSACTSWNPEGPCSVPTLKLWNSSEETVASSPKLASWSVDTSKYWTL